MYVIIVIRMKPFHAELWRRRMGGQSASLTDTKFALERGGERVGSISAKYFARYKYIAIDLPDRRLLK
jgi:hypothetical protein